MGSLLLPLLDYDTIYQLMDHRDHVNLLRPAEPTPGIWADLGAGSGAFTLALRELVGPDASIYAVDKDRAALRALERAHLARFGSNENLWTVAQDLSAPLELPALDGVVMANSLHFFREKQRILQHVRAGLKTGGAFLLVEYNVDTGNHWVPYPLSFESWRRLAPQAGLSEPRLLATVPSRFLKQIYSALAHRAGE